MLPSTSMTSADARADARIFAPRLNWPYLSFVLAASAGALGFMAFFLTRVLIAALLAGRTPPLSLAAIDLGCPLVFLALCFKIWADGKVELTRELVSRPSLRGRQTIRWRDVSSISRFGFGLHVASAKTKIVLSPYAYKEPARLLAAIQQASCT